jgi:uncharacterized protein YaaQ
MKMITAIVQNDDAGPLTDALRENGFQSTLISTTGGFLREGNSTIIIGVEEDKLEQVLGLIQDNCHTRTQYVNPMPPLMEPGELYMPQPVEVPVGGAIVFIMNIERFERY